MIHNKHLNLLNKPQLKQKINVYDIKEFSRQNLLQSDNGTNSI
jgi:hypothetical protein